MDQRIITVAPTGAWPTKRENPNVPMTPQEIAEDVEACYHAGAAICHLHMRDEYGLPTMDAARFEEAVRLIKKSGIDIIINLSTSGALDATDETRQAHIRSIRPEMASYNAGTMNWMHRFVFLNTPDFMEELGRTMLECGIKPEVEIFDAGMVYNAAHYVETGVLQAPVHYQLVLGAAGGMKATIDNLLFLKNLLPADATWSAFGIGRAHVPVMLTTLALGGHLRVGMEDNVYFAAGELAESNAQFVRRAAALIEHAGMKVATPEEAREILGLERVCSFE
ncbi:MAG: 3-keto-5-aminohexanoate cleavage protein [Firmicutes bacterium]|nr:3-keto-5-aminohexanoate cleavage protein [Bacillota bacterium]